MMSNSFSDTRLLWYEIITRPPEVSLFAAPEPKTSATAHADPNLSDEGWVTEAVLESYNG